MLCFDKPGSFNVTSSFGIFISAFLFSYSPRVIPPNSVDIYYVSKIENIF